MVIINLNVYNHEKNKWEKISSLLAGSIVLADPDGNYEEKNLEAAMRQTAEDMKTKFDWVELTRYGKALSFYSNGELVRTVSIEKMKSEDGGMLPDEILEIIGDIKELATQEKGTVVGSINEVHGMLHYTNSIPTQSSIGGIGAGSTFNKVPIKEMFDKLLYPYMAPTISFSASPSGTVREFGDNIASIQFTAYVTKRSEPIEYVKFYMGSTEIHSVQPANPNGGSNSYTYQTPVTSSTSFSSKVSDGKTVVTSGSINYSFVNPMYIGKLTSPSPQASEIKSMNKLVKVKPSSEAYTYDTNNERFCFAFPSSYGSLSSVLDANSFEILPDFEEKTMIITNMAGSGIQYKVYTFKNLTTVSGFRVTFKF